MKRRNLHRKWRDDAPGGFFRACDRCWRTTDDGVQMEQFVDCPVCRGAWLCQSCTNAHRAVSAISGGAR